MVWDWLLFPIIILGHGGTWCAVYNYTHATAMARKTRKIVEKFILLFLFVAFVLMFYRRLQGYVLGIAAWEFWPPLFVYEIYCLAFGAIWTGWWGCRKLLSRKPAELTGHTRETFKVKAVDGPLLCTWDARLLGAIPGNQSTQICVEKKQLTLDTLPRELDSLVISHLSDLHFTGKLSKQFYSEITRLSNESNPDIVVISGDIVDAEHCIEWIEPTLGPLTATYKKYFVLGNHDRRVSNPDKIRDAMKAIGFEPAPGRWIPTEINGAGLFVAGNELPWFYGAETLKVFQRQSDNEFSLLISHSPDQFQFAVEHQVDLVLAGHTHGGQIRFPVIGPVVAPSKHGVKYASGLFRNQDTVMHVSRGLAGDDIIRINCPPELAILELNAGS